MTARRGRPWTAAWAWLLALALLHAQALGLRHRIDHRGERATPVHAALHAHDADRAGAWDHADGDGRCRLLDQLASAGGLPCAEAPSAWPAPVLAPAIGAARSVQTRALPAYLARGPPRA